MRVFAAVAVSLALAACVISPEAGQSGGDPNKLTQSQIMETGLTNLYEVVQRLRPRWISSMGGTLVYLDGVSMGGADAMRNMPPTTALDMEWLSPLEARQRIPNIALEGDVGGVIFIRTRAD